MSYSRTEPGLNAEWILRWAVRFQLTPCAAFTAHAPVSKLGGSQPVFPGMESCFQAQQTLYWTCFLWLFAPSLRPPRPPILSYAPWILFPLKGNSHRIWLVWVLLSPSSLEVSPHLSGRFGRSVSMHVGRHKCLRQL